MSSPAPAGTASSWRRPSASTSPTWFAGTPTPGWSSSIRGDSPSTTSLPPASAGPGSWADARRSAGLQGLSRSGRPSGGDESPGVLDDPPGLDDEYDSVGPVEQLWLGERVALDRDQIGELARLDGANRVALAEDPGVRRRRRYDRTHRVLQPRSDHQFSATPLLFEAEQVAARADVDAERPRQHQRTGHRVFDPLEPRHNQLRQAPIAPVAGHQVDDRERGDQGHAARRHQD